MISILLLLLSVVFIILLTVRWNVHPFLALLGAALLFALFSGMNLATLVDSVNNGFGNTLGKIGIVIVLGVIIGAFLEHSGGAFKLAEWILKGIGRKRVHETMGLVGFVVSIPVFADSGFIILNPDRRSPDDDTRLIFGKQPHRIQACFQFLKNFVAFLSLSDETAHTTFR